MDYQNVEKVNNNFIKKVISNISLLWNKLTTIKKVSFAVIVIAFIAGIIVLLTLPSRKMVPVFMAPINDSNTLSRIVERINLEGIKTSVTTDGFIYVAGEGTARRIRGILIQEDLIPKLLEPWAIFDKERWTVTDFESTEKVLENNDWSGIGTKIVAEVFDIKEFAYGKAIYKDQPILQISGLIGLENFFFNSYEIRASDESGEKILILLYLSNTDHSNSKRINLYIPINDETETAFFGVNQTFIWNRNDPFQSSTKIMDGFLYNFDGTDEYSAYDLLYRFF